MKELRVFCRVLAFAVALAVVLLFGLVVALVMDAMIPVEGKLRDWVQSLRAGVDQ